MTVQKLKEMLNSYPDDYRVAVDCTDPEEGITKDNEIVCGYSVSTPLKGDIPVIFLQTRNDFDYETELEAVLNEWEEKGVDEDYAIAELYDNGYTYRDLQFNKQAYEWAKKYAKEHGYE